MWFLISKQTLCDADAVPPPTQMKAGKYLGGVQELWQLEIPFLVCSQILQKEHTHTHKQTNLTHTHKHANKLHSLTQTDKQTSLMRKHTNKPHSHKLPSLLITGHVEERFSVCVRGGNSTERGRTIL